MKKYILIYKTLKANRKLVLFNFIILIIVISSVLGYFGTVYGRQYELYANKNYIIYGQSNINFNDMKSKLDTHLDISFYIIKSTDSFKYPYGTEDDLFWISMVSNNYLFSNDLKGTSILDKNISSNSCIIPYELSIANSISMNDNVNVNGFELNVIGTIGMTMESNTFIITQELFESMDLNNLEVTMIVNRDISKEKYESIIHSLKDYFIKINYSDFDTETAAYLNQFRLYSVVVFAASAINLVYMYNYIIEFRKKRISTYRNVGATKKFLTSALLIENLILFSIGFIISIFLTHALFSYVLLKQINNLSFRLPPSEILRFYLQMLSIYIIQIAIFSLKLTTNISKRKGGKKI